MKSFFKSLFRRIRRIGRKPDLLTRVLDRYKANAPIDPFVRDLFKSETRETMNARYGRALREIDD